MEKVFSEKLKAVRKESGLNQRQVAKKLEISTTCYAGYEQGYRQPDLITLRKICILFDISSDYLLDLEK